MPKISDARRAERRTQIIDAARACFDRQGPHATTMDDIIRMSGLSAGAVYSYFRSKDELVVAALTASLTGLRERLEPLFRREPVPEPAELVRAIVEGVAGYSAKEAFDLKRVAVQGWAEAQRNEPLRATLRSFYIGYRDLLVGIAGTWKRSGAIDSAADPDDVGKMLLALFLGFVAEATILGDVEPAAIDRGLQGLVAPAAMPGRARRRPAPGARRADHAA